MVKHVILWKLKDEITGDAKEKVLREMKENLEALVGKVPGLLRLEIVTKPMASSNADVMLDSTFTDFNALKNYAVHPEHVKVADRDVRPFTAHRSCLDYEI
jgi:antibiotic biosynthesis monooxygenase (ABM) superfamily enzyme